MIDSFEINDKILLLEYRIQVQNIFTMFTEIFI